MYQPDEEYLDLLMQHAAWIRQKLAEHDKIAIHHSLLCLSSHLLLVLKVSEDKDIWKRLMAMGIISFAVVALHIADNPHDHRKEKYSEESILAALGEQPTQEMLNQLNRHLLEEMNKIEGEEAAERERRNMLQPFNHTVNMLLTNDLFGKAGAIASAVSSAVFEIYEAVKEARSPSRPVRK